MLLNALHRLPDLAILVIVVVLISALSVLAPMIGHRILGFREDEERQDAALDGYKAIMGMIGVVLAFSLVQANGNLQAVQSLVGKEATALAAVDRVLLRSGQPDLIALRPALADFGTKVVQSEWPLLATANRSPDADAAYTKLSRGVRAVSPTDQRQQAMYGELLKQMDDLSELREQVIEASDISLPNFFWITAAGLLFVALALASATADNIKQRVAVAATAAAVALLLTFVIIIDRPFEGETSVSAGPISKALQRNSHRADLGLGAGSKHATDGGHLPGDG
jgi:hypothetical protein